MQSKPDLIIGTAVRQLRERAGWAQKELAIRAGLRFPQTVSAIEKGERSLKAVELARLAAVFHVEFSDLLSGRIPGGSQPVLWREPRAGDAREPEEALFLQRCRRYASVERIIGEQTEPTLPSFSLDLKTTSYEKADRWAEKVGKTLDLGDIPALTLRKVLEEHAGVKVFLAPLEGGSGAAVRGDFGDAILESSGEPAGRRAFSLGHELFHLLTWDATKTLTPDLESRNEQLANVFASSLILPSSKVRELMGAQPLEEWPWHRFLPIAESMAVSPLALLWRLVNLELLSERRVRALLSGPRRKENGAARQNIPAERELPRRYVLLAFRAWADGLISIGKLAVLLETSVGMLEPRLAEYGLDLDEDSDETADLPS